MNSPKIATLLLLLAFAFTATAQKAKLSRADRMYKELNYQGAIEAYLNILDKRDEPEAKRKLADCYRKVGNTVDAEYWYGQVVRLSDVKPEEKLYYGMALQANGKCDLARQWYDEYTTINPSDLRGQLLAKACENNEVERLQKLGALYQVKNVEALNTAFDDFGPAYFEDGLVFSSERDGGVSIKREHTWTGHPFLELFFSKASVVDEASKEFSYSKPDKYSNKINTRFHDGPVSFSADFSEMFFTRNNLVNGSAKKDDQGVIRLKIFSSRKANGGWGSAESLPFNSDEYSVAHPALSKDGSKLYFTSDMPGGFGGFDLYVSYMENGRWSPPENLGPVINTEGNEVFPFVHEDGVLYFASDGHTGLGGLDIYYTTPRSGTWSPVTNMGNPINTISDDFGIIFNAEKTHGYLSSNREGGAGYDDIYSFTRFANNVEVLVYDKYSGDPIEGSTVVTGYEAIPNLITGIDGKATIQLPMEQTYTFVASKPLYDDNSAPVSTRNVKPNQTILVKIPLEMPLNIRVVGKITDEETGKPIPGARVILESDCGQETQEMLSNTDGGYQFELRPNCCYVLKVIFQDYITKVESFCTNVKDIDPANPVVIEDIALVSTKPIGPPDGKQEVIVDKPQILHIYYNFDRAEIRTDAVADLNNLYSFVKDHPTYVIEIGSHTDARGSKSYNEKLSARRAESVVRWLIAKGISKDRLRARGYGETTPTNDCFDNIPCSEEKHQKNRRTEFRVVGTSGEVAKSGAKENITIDPCKKCPF